MDKWMTVAEELRAARRASEEFFVRAFVDHSIIGPLLLDRIAADLVGFSDFQMSTVMPSLQSMRRLADER